MPRRLTHIAVLALSVLLAACGTITAPLPQIAPTTAPTAAAIPPSATPPPTETVTPSPSPAPTMAAITTPEAPPRTAGPEVVGPVFALPGPTHYEGDVLSFEAALGNSAAYPRGEPVLMSINAGEFIAVEAWAFRHVLLDDRLILPDAWDTTGQVGTNVIELLVPQNEDGDTQTVIFQVEVLPAADRPLQEQRAEWAERLTDCCRLIYLTGTAADRDIDRIAALADDAVTRVEERLGFEVENTPVPIVLIDNVWGNGGYAAGELVVSYLDRDYTGKQGFELFELLMNHEAVHWAANPLQEETPTLLVEGIAVYLTGGHYKLEPIPQRAAALLETGLYIPLAALTDDFRGHQHEISYIQAAGLVAYLEEAYGWQRFLEFYSIDDLDLEGAAWLDAAAQRAYGITLEELEADYIAWLEGFDPAEQGRDIILTINMFEALRLYQRERTPYEYLPSIDYAIENDITYSFMRQTTIPEDVAIELMLMAVGDAIFTGDYATAERLLAQINAAVTDNDFRATPARDYLEAVRALQGAGYTVQSLTIEGETATATVTEDGSTALWEVTVDMAEWRVLD